MNWRDPKTDLVHIVNYHAYESPWFSSRTGEMGDRTMCCGLHLRVDVGGAFDLANGLFMQFNHTSDIPTCLVCIVWTPDTATEEATDGVDGFVVVDEYDSGDAPDEQDEDSLDRDGKA